MNGVPPSIPPGQSWCDSDDDTGPFGASAAPALKSSRKRKARVRPTSEHETTMTFLVDMGYNKQAVELVVLEAGLTDVGAAVEFLTENPTGQRVRPKRSKTVRDARQQPTKQASAKQTPSKRRPVGQAPYCTPSGTLGFSPTLYSKC